MAGPPRGRPCGLLEGSVVNKEGAMGKEESPGTVIKFHCAVFHLTLALVWCRPFELAVLDLQFSKPHRISGSWLGRRCSGKGILCSWDTSRAEETIVHESLMNTIYGSNGEEEESFRGADVLGFYFD